MTPSQSYEARAVKAINAWETENGLDPRLTALRLAVSALGYVTEAGTLTAAKTTAGGALLGIAKDLGG